MDSATSGSLQSSSGGGGGGGGDDELDSRPDALSAFFHGPALSHPFDSFSHYLSPPSPLLPFSASSAPGPGPTNPNPSRPFLSSSASSHGPTAAPASAGAGAAATGQQRSSRKRTRASRRAPTTVLTTDTTNFRAMVQEFTGIPSPPFAAAAAAAAAATTLQYRSSARFGGHILSGGGASSSSDPAAQPQQQQPPYLLRPFAQKLHPFPPLSSSSCPTPANTHSPTATTNTCTATNTIPITATLTTCSSSGGSSNLTTPTNTNYQLPSPHHSLLNTQHPILSFQSLLQSQPPSNYAMPNMLTFSTRPPHSTVSSTQYGSGDVGLPPGLIGSEEFSGWAGGSTASQSRPAGPNYAAGSAPQQRGSSCKVNYSSAAGSSAPDQFNVAKGSSAPENAAAGAAATTATTTTTGEGTVDSWICSSRRDH